MKELQEMKQQIDSDISRLKQYVKEHESEIVAQIKEQLHLDKSSSVDIFIGQNGLINAYYIKEGQSMWSYYNSLTDKWA